MFERNECLKLIQNELLNMLNGSTHAIDTNKLRRSMSIIQIQLNRIDYEDGKL